MQRGSSEMLEPSEQATLRHTPEDCNLTVANSISQGETCRIMRVPIRHTELSRNT